MTNLEVFKDPYDYNYQSERKQNSPQHEPSLLSSEQRIVEVITDHSDLSSSPRPQSPSEMDIREPEPKIEENNDIIGLNEDEINEELINWAGKLEMESIDIREKSGNLSSELERNTKVLELLKQEMKESLQVLNFDQKVAFNSIKGSLSNLNVNSSNIPEQGGVNIKSGVFSNVSTSSTAAILRRIDELEKLVESLISLLNGTTKTCKTSLPKSLPLLIQDLETTTARLESKLKKIEKTESTNRLGIGSINRILNKMMDRMESLSNSSNGIQYFLDDINRGQQKLNRDFCRFKDRLQHQFYSNNVTSTDPLGSLLNVSRRAKNPSQIEELDEKTPPFVIESLGGRERSKRKAKVLYYDDNQEEEEEEEEGKEEEVSQHILLTPENSVVETRKYLGHNTYNEELPLKKIRELAFEALANLEIIPVKVTAEIIYKVLDYMFDHSSANMEVFKKLLVAEYSRVYEVALNRIKVCNKMISEETFEMYKRGECSMEDIEYVRTGRKRVQYLIKSSKDFFSKLKDIIIKTREKKSQQKTSVSNQNQNHLRPNSTPLFYQRNPSKRMLLEHVYDDSSLILRSRQLSQDRSIIDYNVKSKQDQLLNTNDTASDGKSEDENNDTITIIEEI